MIRVYNALRAAGLTPAEAKDVGWTKSRVIAPVLLEPGGKDWIEVAKNHGRTQLAAMVKKHLAQIAPEKPAELTKPQPKAKVNGLKKQLISLGAADPSELTELIIDVLGSLDQAVSAQIIQALTASKAASD
jgi:hypothetical protein